jgi:hypothetical protein
VWWVSLRVWGVGIVSEVDGNGARGQESVDSLLVEFWWASGCWKGVGVVGCGLGLWWEGEEQVRGDLMCLRLLRFHMPSASTPVG